VALGIVGAAHTGITVVDLERSLSFWRDTLGFEVFVRDTLSGEPLERITGVHGGAMSFAILLVPGGHQIKLMQYIAPAGREHLRPRPSDVGTVHLALYVEDIHAFVAGVRAAGWHAAGPGFTVPVGPLKGATFVYLTDPDGTTIELVQMA
jgi:catechol 2,3-dioxygenase-like lactoylglutathione lyase family enzyme